MFLTSLKTAVVPAIICHTMKLGFDGFCRLGRSENDEKVYDQNGKGGLGRSGR